MHLTSGLVAVTAAMLVGGDLPSCKASNVPNARSEIATDPFSTAGTRKLRIHPSQHWSTPNEERAGRLPAEMGLGDKGLVLESSEYAKQIKEMHDHDKKMQEFADGLGVGELWRSEKYDQIDANSRALLNTYLGHLASKKKREAGEETKNRFGLN
ncbi:hypothetical protein PsorP6_011344 [Peronosclerospora sorghi]|uniref:Uncharacterized protein n=1 Tax=Peronosclerospora sorghi TaxID=230839 RepID=A0ACC0WLB8_9STRA|nr:hypothetical protein PsorP6_011344 [Peronosclerospora sorghi]